LGCQTYGVGVSTGTSVSVGSSVSVGTATVLVAAAFVAVGGTIVRVLVDVVAAAVGESRVVTVVLVTATVATGVAVLVVVLLPLSITVLVEVAGVPDNVTVKKPVGVVGSIVIVWVMFSVGTGTMYGVSVGALGFAAAAVARAGALGLDGKFGAVVGMMIWIAPVPLTMAVVVRTAASTFIGVSVC